MSLGLGLRVPRERRRVRRQQQVHRHHLDAERRPGRLDAARCEDEALAAHAEHLRHRGPVEIRVEDANPEATEGQAASQVRGQRRLADSALARDDRADGVDGGQALAEPGLLSLDLADDVRAAVARDVLVLFHAAPSAALVTARLAPRRRLGSPDSPIIARLAPLRRLGSHDSPIIARLAPRRRSARTSTPRAPAWPPAPPPPAASGPPP